MSPQGNNTKNEKGKKRARPSPEEDGRLRPEFGESSSVAAASRRPSQPYIPIRPKEVPSTPPATPNVQRGHHRSQRQDLGTRLGHAVFPPELTDFLLSDISTMPLAMSTIFSTQQALERANGTTTDQQVINSPNTIPRSATTTHTQPRRGTSPSSPSVQRRHYRSIAPATPRAPATPSQEAVQQPTPSSVRGRRRGSMTRSPHTPRQSR